MAARRDRDRRRPAGERRYRFGPSETNPTLQDDATAATRADEPTSGSNGGPPQRAAIRLDDRAVVATRGGARVAARPFSAYAAEYAYVLGDLRRVALVIGSLLVVLLVLFFVLPR